MAQAPKQVFELFPWAGGLNSSVDPIILNPQQLQIAENIVFDVSGGRKKRPGITYLNTATITVSSVAADIIWATDYWANVSNTKRAYHVAITSGGKALRSAYSGTYSAFNSASTAVLSIVQGQITSEVFNEDLIIGYAKSAVPKVWDNQNTAVNLVNATATTGTYPSGWILRAHKNRLFVTGSNTNPDRVYYSGFTAGVPDHRAWNTASSAGFVDIFPGDGDPEGITSIFPEINRGGLYIAKRTKIYYLDTSDIDDANWSVSLVSDGIGCVSHNSAVAVDQTDIIFASDRGIHSLGQVITQAGIIESAFLSNDIHIDYQDNLDTSKRFRYSAAWYPKINSYLLSVADTAGNFVCIYAYNVEYKQWYIWKPASGTENTFEFLFNRFNGSTKQMEILACSKKGHFLKFDDTIYYDQTGTATITTVPVVLRIKSAVLYPGASRVTESHFTDLGFYCSSKNSSSFSVFWTIDGFNTQNKSVAQAIAGSNVLGTTILGSSFVLGETRGVKPYNVGINGVGNGIELEIQHSAPEDFQLYGMIIKFINSNVSYRTGVA